jgi:hypothetical protein
MNRAGTNDSWFDPQFVDAIARRMLELARQPDLGHQTPPSLLTVAEVAERLRVSPKWVYANQHRLGAIKLGDGPKARLRFDESVIAADLRRQETAVVRSGPGSPESEEPLKKRRRRRLVSRPLPAIDGARGPS